MSIFPKNSPYSLGAELMTIEMTSASVSFTAEMVVNIKKQTFDYEIKIKSRSIRNSYEFIDRVLTDLANSYIKRKNEND